MQIMGREFENSGNVHKNSVARGGAKYNFPVLHSGTPWVPKTGPYILERGEEVKSKSDARRATFSFAGANFNFYGSDGRKAGRDFMSEIQRLGLKASLQGA
jgi:hypothetical protein